MRVSVDAWGILPVILSVFCVTSVLLVMMFVAVQVNVSDSLQDLTLTSIILLWWVWFSAVQV